MEYTGLETYSRALAFMNQNVSQKLTVKDIAFHCNVSTSGLEKVFSKYYGAGVMAYFRELKLEEAKKMLKSGYTVFAIAQTLQYSSSAHFSAAFKKKYGISPLKYKHEKRLKAQKERKL